MRWTRYRGIKKVSMDTTLICAAMNLKKLAMWIVKEPQIAYIKRSLIIILVKNINLYKKTN